MTPATTSSTTIAPSRTTAALGLGLLVQSGLAGGVADSHHQWLTWHENLGDVLVLIPLSCLGLRLGLRRRRPESRHLLAPRAGLFAAIVAVVATGHAGGNWLALHVTVAVAAMGLVARQATLSRFAHRGRSGAARRPRPGTGHEGP